MLGASDIDLLPEVRSDPLSHLLPSSEFRHSIVFCRSSHGLLTLARLLLIKHGGLGGGALLAPSSLSQVPLPLFGLPILLGREKLSAVIAELVGQHLPLLLVTHDLGASMVRNHLYRYEQKLASSLLVPRNNCEMPATHVQAAKDLIVELFRSIFALMAIEFVSQQHTYLHAFLSLLKCALLLGLLCIL